MAVGNWTEQAINFIVFVTLARLLGAEAFGLLAMASALVVLSEFMVRESLSEYVIAAQDSSTEDVNSVFWMLAGLGVCLTLLLVILSGPVARFYDEPDVQALIVSLSPTVLLIALTAVPVALLRRDLRFATLSIRAIAGVVAGGCVGIGMAVNDFGLWSLVGQRLVQVATNVSLAWFGVAWRPSLAVSLAHVKRIVKFSSHMLGLRAAELTATQVPLVIIGSTLGPVALGFFSIAWRLVETGSFLIVTPLRMAAQPAFAAMKRNAAGASDLLVDLSRLTGFVAFPAFAGLATLSGLILRVVFGEEWVPAAEVVSVLSLFGCYLCVAKIEHSFCLAHFRVGFLSLLSWVEVAISIGLIWVGSRWGIVGITAAFVCGFYLMWAARLRFVAQVAGLSPVQLIGPHVRPAVAAFGMSVAVSLAVSGLGGLSPALRLGLGVGLGVFVYGALAFALMRDRVALLQSYVALARASEKKET